MISRKFFEAVKLAPIREYRIAQQADLHPSTLSKILNGVEKVKSGDPRVIRVAGILGLQPDDCFVDEGVNGKPEGGRSNADG